MIMRMVRSDHNVGAEAVGMRTVDVDEREKGLEPWRQGDETLCGG